MLGILILGVSSFTSAVRKTREFNLKPHKNRFENEKHALKTILQGQEWALQEKKHSKTRHDRLLRFDPNSKAGKVAGGPDSLDKYGVWVVIVDSYTPEN